MNKNTIVISAFPACGKTYAYNMLKKDGLAILDSDSSEFSWCYKSNNIDKYRNPEFPRNYMEHIKDNIGKVDLIFVSSHKEVRFALEEHGIKYVMVYPDKNKMKAEWISRCYLRGSGDTFCEMLNKNWNEWIEGIESEKDTSKYRVSEYVLDKSQPYLKDIIDLLNYK